MEVIKKVKKWEEYDRVDKVVCDKCNLDIEEEGFEVYEFELSRRSGTAYPDCVDHETESIDLCQKCSAELFQKLRAEGYRVNVKEYSN